MDDQELALFHSTFDGEQAAADLWAELEQDRELDLPSRNDLVFSDESREAADAHTNMESEQNRAHGEYSEQPFDIDAFEGKIPQYDSQNKLSCF